MSLIEREAGERSDKSRYLDMIEAAQVRQLQAQGHSERAANRIIDGRTEDGSALDDDDGGNRIRRRRATQQHERYERARKEAHRIAAQQREMYGLPSWQL